MFWSFYARWWAPSNWLICSGVAGLVRCHPISSKAQTVTFTLAAAGPSISMGISDRCYATISSENCAESDRFKAKIQTLQHARCVELLWYCMVCATTTSCGLRLDGKLVHQLILLAQNLSEKSNILHNTQNMLSQSVMRLSYWSCMVLLPTTPRTQIW